MTGTSVLVTLDSAVGCIVPVSHNEDCVHHLSGRLNVPPGAPCYSSSREDHGGWGGGGGDDF